MKAPHTQDVKKQIISSIQIFPLFSLFNNIPPKLPN